MAEENKVTEEILRQWLECNTVCDLGTIPTVKRDDFKDKVEYYMTVLPGITYILSRMLDFIFANNLTTGSINQDPVLEGFLYRLNEQETTNYAVLRDAIGIAITHGSCGIRWYGDNIYRYNPGTFRALTERENGIVKVRAYVVSENPAKKIDNIVLGWNREDEDITYADFVRHISMQGLILLDRSEFMNLRNKTQYPYGECPFDRDELRLELLISTYKQLIKDLLYDGPGRIIVRPKDGYITGEINDVSTASVINQSMEAARTRKHNIEKELHRVADDIKNSGSDQVIMLSNVFGQEIEKLPRVTKATEFLNWVMREEGVILAQSLGMSPSILELGGISGNVSMEKIIDNAMVNNIVPVRENFATQFSPFLSENLGIEKVYFNKYEMQQAEDANTMRTKVANIMTLLNSIGTEETNNLVRDFAAMMSANIHNENNALVELKVGNRKERKGEHGTVDDFGNAYTGGRD